MPTQEIDNGLIHVLAEHWWDTTHTLWIENVGEMTMTPKDFCVITGVPAGRRHIKLCRHMTNTLEYRRKMLGEEILCWSSDRVPILWIYETYSHRSCIDDESSHIVVRAFMLFIIGAILFPDIDDQVSLKFLPFLENIDLISTYNWGATTMANLYHEMDDLCRGIKYTIGGLSYAWEVCTKLFIISSE